MNKSEDMDLQVYGYIMMGLSLSFPIILYAMMRNVFRYFMDLDTAPIGLLVVLLVLNLGILVCLHISDIRTLREQYGNVDKLLATVLVFQPAYFVCRQDILGRPKKGAIIYAVISTMEIMIVLFACVIACFKDMLSLLW